MIKIKLEEFYKKKAHNKIACWCLQIVVDSTTISYIPCWGVNFINMLTRCFYMRKCSSPQLLFHQKYLAQLYQCTQLEFKPMNLEKCWGIDTWSQFHQRSTSSIYARRPRKRKKTVKLSIFFALLGSGGIKAAHKMLVELTPDVMPPLQPKTRFNFLSERGQWENRVRVDPHGGDHFGSLFPCTLFVKQYSFIQRFSIVSFLIQSPEIH